MPSEVPENAVKSTGFSKSLTDFEGVVKPKKRWLTGL